MKKHTYKYIKNKIEITGYKLLSKEYKGTHIKLKVECPKRHQYEVEYNHFQNGIRCPICFGNQKHSYDFVKQQFEEKGYKLLSDEYKNCMSMILVECPEGHQYEVRYNDFQQDRRCPICWELETYSRSEKDCLCIIKQLTNENIIENNRTQIINPRTNQNLELDMWIPSLNKAIEFNGEYWHESDYSKYKDRQKEIQCKEKNIDLLTIWYQDWVDNKEEQTQRLNQFLNNKNVKYDKI